MSHGKAETLYHFYHRTVHQFIRGQPDHQGDAGDIAHFVDPVRAESQLPVQPGAVHHFFQPFSHRAATDHFRQKLQAGARPSDPGIHCLRILHRLQHVSAVGSGTGSICMEDDLPAAGLSDSGIRSVHGSAGRRGHAPGRILRAGHRVPVAHGFRDHQDLL